MKFEYYVIMDTESMYLELLDAKLLDQIHILSAIAYKYMRLFLSYSSFDKMQMWH